MATVPASVALLGPPEARAMAGSAAAAASPAPVPTPVTPANASATTKIAPSGRFMDLMVANFNKPPMGMGLTENLSPTFLSSGNPCLDFFFQVVPNTRAPVVTDLLASAWNQEALTALKLVCHLRGVRGTGKSDKEGFYTAALWVHRNHPKTLALNVHSIARFGYIKDLPEILYRLLNGADVRKIAKQERKAKTRARIFRGWGCGRGGGGGGRGRGRGRGRRGCVFDATQRKELKQGTREERVAAELARLKIVMDNASQMRKNKRAEMATRALDRYRNDPDYRLLHDCIAEFLATQLRLDMKSLRSGDTTRIGLAAKWCPSLDSSFDLSTLLCESVARRIFPRGEFHPEYEGLEEGHYAYRVRDRLRKEVLVPLRAALQLPEVYMSANLWGELPYNRVASVAMKTYKGLFRKHDGERFAEFLGQVREGKAKIAAGALLPHEIVKQVMTPSYYCYGYVDGEGEDDGVAELQWMRMVSDLKEKGKLHNCLAVCDVSGSMSGTPMEVSVALGLLTSELCEEPWKGKVITFSETPQLHAVAGESLREKVSFVLQMDWGSNTDFQVVFDRILEVAVAGRLLREKMVKRVFVFSDMEFDQASANPWETDYQAIRRKYLESGYGDAVPEIVFWNLRDSRSTPVPSGQEGVALVSGFSQNLMTLFLDGDGVLKPEDVMMKAVAGKEYRNLALFD